MTVDCWKRRWYLWVFLVFFLLLNVHGWHAYFWISFILIILLIIMHIILKRIVTRVALRITENYARKIGREDLIIQQSDKHFWFHPPSVILFQKLVQHLIRFILFQNAYQMAIFVWIGITFGFDSCMMEQLYYPVPKLIIGVCTLGLCGYSTLPLYAIVTEMGDAFSQERLDDIIEMGHIE
ncbi:Mlo15p [Trifolium repens]|nr:Mlo15p [Trifolium repens]